MVDQKNALRAGLRFECLEDRRLLATITVTSLSDGTLAQLAGDGQVSLREAIEAADTDGSIDGSVAGDPGLDTIVFEPGLSGTISLSDGEFDVGEPLEIIGNGRADTVIDAQLNSRIFDAGAGFVLRDLTLRRGRTTENLRSGGAIFFASQNGSLDIFDCTIEDSSTLGSGAKGGAIAAIGDVTVFMSTIADNFTQDDNAWGGAIYGTAGDIRIQFSTISGNETHGDFGHGGAVAGERIVVDFSELYDNRTIGEDSDGGAIYAAGNEPVSIDSSTLRDNTAARHGGAVQAAQLSIADSLLMANTASGTGGGAASVYLTVLQSVVSTNSAALSGGGLSTRELLLVESWIQDNESGSSGGGLDLNEADIRSSTVSGNRATTRGGGVRAAGPSDGVRIENSTISANLVQGGTSPAGGGIRAHNAPLLIRHSTITDNTAVGPNGQGGGLEIFSDDLTILSSIVSGNDASTGPDVHPILAPLFVSYSIIGDQSGTSLTEANPTRDASGNLIGGPISGVADPILGPLAYQGGPTPTQALSLVSPALDFGIDQLGGFLPQHDQRGAGFPRDRDGDDDGVSLVDAGAYELRVLTAVAVNFSITAVVGSITAGPADLASYDPGSDSWSIVFDGSDVGLSGVQVDAQHFEPDGSILMSFDRPVTLNDIGDVDHNDIVKFWPISLGDNTQGFFEFFIRGFEIDLDGDDSNIDAITRDQLGQLMISTTGTTAAGDPHDLMLVNGNSLLPYFQGEFVGLNTAEENITGAWVEPGTGVIFVTLEGAYSINGVGGNEGDVIAFSNYSNDCGCGTFHTVSRLAGLDVDIPIAGVNIETSHIVSTTLGNRVFEDRNRNGQQDADEPGLPDVSVVLLDSGGNTLASTTTDDLGQYYFADLAAGDYRLRVARPAGLRFTTPDAVVDDDRDSDFHPRRGTSHLVSLFHGEIETSLDAGMFAFPPAVVATAWGEAPPVPSQPSLPAGPQAALLDWLWAGWGDEEDD